MPSTTYPEFGHDTEALEVAKAFADVVRDKTIIVTGGNRSGIAFSTAEALVSITMSSPCPTQLIIIQVAQAPARLIVASRSLDKIQEFTNALKKEYPNVDYRHLQVDLSSQDSVRAAAANLMSWADVPAVDILINTAGVMGIQERTLTKEGIEMHLATNHLGHWLFTCLIAPKLIKAAESNPKGATRIVNVSSRSPTISAMRWSDMTFEVKNKDLPETEQPNYQYMDAWGYTDAKNRAYVPVDGYHRSKVANILFGIGANRRLFEKHGILSVGLHPGVIATELARNFPEETLKQINVMAQRGFMSYKTLGAGASTSLVAALDPKLAEGVGESKDGRENWGAYMEDCQPSGKANPLAVSSSEAERLWDFSEKSVGQSFSW